ncbi:MAG: glutamate-5-semialdehyde dehydrogenase [Acidobacteriota bacterium]
MNPATTSTATAPTDTTPGDPSSFDPASTARAVRRAQRAYGATPTPIRRAVLGRLGDLLGEREDEILAANQFDLERAEADDLATPLRRRLALSAGKLATLRDGVAQLAEADDPIGRVLRRTELDGGLVLRQVTSPLGVLLIVFESRPDAVVQIGSLSLATGNGVILKGGSEASASNRALVGCLRDALVDEAQPADAVVGIEGREAVAGLLACDHDIDLVIPRGSGALVRSIQNATRIPVLGHAEGVCHLVLDAAADPEMAARLAVDGKTDYPAACNATETLLVHRDFLPRFSVVAEALRAAGVTLRADASARAVVPWADVATETDGSTEYGDLILAVRTIDDLDDAIEQVHRHGSAHTDAICTNNPDVGEAFLRRVDSASVFWNASTRFADGYRYGLGAEVGIATGRIHARGPVGADGLTTTRWLLEGQGHVASDYGEGGRAFAHHALPVD